jgi:hypothetical protein
MCLGVAMEQAFSGCMNTQRRGGNFRSQRLFYFRKVQNLNSFLSIFGWGTP